MSEMTLPKPLKKIARDAFEKSLSGEEPWARVALAVARECANIADAYVTIADISDVPADPRAAQKEAARSIAAAILLRVHTS